MERPLLLKITAGLGLALMLVPSVVFVRVAGRYFSFLGAWERPPGLSPAPAHGFPHPTGTRPEPSMALNRKIQFVPFRLKAPKAAEVLLVGDFNLWDADGTELENHGETWETVVPLPPGSYHYLFKVDGIWTPDPTRSKTGRRGPLTTSVLEVRP